MHLSKSVNFDKDMMKILKNPNIFTSKWFLYKSQMFS